MRALLFTLSLISSFVFTQTDCEGVEGGMAVCLSFENVNQDTGDLEIHYNSIHPISGFQMNITEITIESAETDLGFLEFSVSTGFVLGYLSAGYLPASDDGVLLALEFTPQGETISCLENIIIGGQGGVSFSPIISDCADIPSAYVDCEGEYGGPVLPEENYDCNGNCVVTVDCYGECDGTAYTNSCELCVEGNTGVSNTNDLEGDYAGEYGMDCNLECDSTGYVDECGECNGDGWCSCDSDNDGELNCDEWGYGAYNIEVNDVLNDQGTHVYIQFNKSFYDTDTLRTTESYTIERLDDDIWTSLHSISAYGADTYQTVAETLSDSVSVEENGLTQFRIIAAMEEGNYASLIDGVGYSVDNIHPATPDNVVASNPTNSDTLNLSWDYTLDIDFAYHEIVENTESSLYTIENAISPEITIAQFYNEYHINSLDIHNNRSEDSEYTSAHNLHYGSNLVSYNISPGDISVSNIFQDMFSAVIGEGEAAHHLGDSFWVGSLQEISSCNGYWVKTDSDRIHTVIGERAICEEYELHYGSNLKGNPCIYDTEIGDAITNPCIISVLGEGTAATLLPSDIWVGSLMNIKPGRGYWFKSECAEDTVLEFNCSESYTGSASRVNENLYQDDSWVQSTEQAFYFFEDIEGIEVGDKVEAYCNDAIVGSRIWNGDYTDIPAMGKDGNSYTKDYCQSGVVPTFKLTKSNEEYILEGDFPAWSSNGVYIVTSAHIASPTPEAFSISNAYPNPFNPVINITISVPDDSKVLLEVYDINGNNIETLLSGNMISGYYNILWDASGFASGIYFVTMRSSSFVSTQKVMLVK